LPNDKKVICLFTKKQGNSFFPELYSFDMNTVELLKIFPLDSEDLHTEVLDNYSPQTCAISYNTFARMYCVTYYALDKATNEMVFINFKIQKALEHKLSNIEIYEKGNTNVSLLPPKCPCATSETIIYVPLNQTVTKTIVTEDTTARFELIGSYPGVSLTSGGVLTIFMTNPGVAEHVNYKLTNKKGTTYCAITILT
jgi:hypothetical protein